MCGIAGMLHTDLQKPIDRETLQKMGDVMAHRGPDGDGFFVEGNVGLAHRRLSIIDLSTGDQPMLNEDGSIVVVFNGEIYNYVEVREELKGMGFQFHTTSDTEVIIRAYEAWGLDCQAKFNGMWAFALWDKKEQQLLISRDRMGEKPLNYSFDGQTLLFGSEIKCLEAAGFRLQPNPEMLELYLFLGYVPEPYTLYKNIAKLAAGHFLLLKNGDLQTHPYWDVPVVDEANMRKDEQGVIEEFSALFEDAVRIRMRSDVPFGAFLSGGLDSSSIVAHMASISQQPVETFTIGFEEKAFDERAQAQLVAQTFRTRHTAHVVEPDSLDESLQKILFHYDEPFADPAAIPTGFVSQCAVDRVKMVLTGDGGDELLAGYSTYQSERMAGQYGKAPGFIRQFIPKAVHGAAYMFQGDMRYKLNRMDRVLTAFNLPFQDRLITKFVKIPPAQMKELSPENHFPIEQFIHDSLAGSGLKDPFYQLMHYNLKVSLPGQMLVKVDKMSMAHSLETRAPFLDHRLVELMYGVHKDVKLPQHSGVKHVLKKSIEGRLPDEIIYRKKKGFDVPLREWFKGDSFNQKLGMDFGAVGLNQSLITRIIQENKSGKADHGTLIWRLMVYKKWMDQF